jgi:hypothetical protein
LLALSARKKSRGKDKRKRKKGKSERECRKGISKDRAEDAGETASVV